MSTKEKLTKEKLKNLSKNVRVGGKGTTRRTVKKKTRPSSENEKIIISTVKKLGAQEIKGIDQVIMIKKDHKILQFAKPSGLFFPIIFDNQYLFEKKKYIIKKIFFFFFQTNKIAIKLRPIWFSFENIVQAVTNANLFMISGTVTEKSEWF